GNYQDCATCVAQSQQLTTDLCGSTHIDAPGRLGDQQDPRLTRDFPPDDVLLQIATGQTGRGRLRTMRTHLEAVDDATGEGSQYGAPNKATPDRVRILMRQKHILRQRKIRHSTSTETFLWDKPQPLSTTPSRRGMAYWLAFKNQSVARRPPIFPGQYSKQLLLTIARDAGHPEDFAFAQVQTYVG